MRSRPNRIPNSSRPSSHCSASSTVHASAGRGLDTYNPSSSAR
jgi:hypothetical protein